MSQSFKPKHMPSFVPYLTVRDADIASAFYRDAFQFTFLHSPEKENDKIVHAEMRLGDAVIMMAPEGAFGSKKKAPVSQGNNHSSVYYIYVPDVDAFYQHAKANGATVISQPEDMFWGDRCCQFKDLDGYEWSFATHKAANA